MKHYDYIVITDIGSTTTKGLLLKNDSGKCTVLCVENSPTTVEKPVEDVRIGLYNSIRLMESKSGVKLFTSGSDSNNPVFNDNICYITTSSAGGGLQILVIGLTLNESASSSQRAAYGAGGVILDTLAIDDKRTAVEQVGLIDLLRPDIILLSGGVDGGAYASVIRLSEILKVSNPKPKFGVETKIPLIYAGNIMARDFVKTVLGDKFDLHFVDNIRPALKEENLNPARDEIHRIFMENVMEQAPGYAKLKNMVDDDIIPTPSGVLKSLETFSKAGDKNVIAFDIGGATTDIFSNIFKKYYRTVSANYGMSYSIANVMADCGFESIRNRLPKEIDDDYIRNYICNKMLYPTYLPQNDIQQAIEHAAAKEAVRMSCQHHFRMNFRIHNIGHLDKMKEETCKFYDAMYYEESIKAQKFFLKDFDVILASGGIVTGAEDKKRIAYLVSDAMDIDGITEIWYDNHFLSPHLGKLSELYPEAAEDVLFKEGYRKLAISVKPLSKPIKKKVKLMTVKITGDNRNEIYELFNEELRLIDVKSEVKVEIKCSNRCSFGDKKNKIDFSADVPLLIDTRKTDKGFRNNELYNFSTTNTGLEESFAKFTESKQINKGEAVISRSLPYPGVIYVREGEAVRPDSLLGEVKFEPPMLYILNLITSVGINKEEFREGLSVKDGESIKTGQVIFSLSSKTVFGYKRFYESPVTGIIEKINYETGSIYLREIQDYPLKPMKIKVADQIGIKPKNIKGYMKRELGDFVRTGELLARNLSGKADDPENKGNPILVSPTTGTITDINNEDGSITIQYIKKSIPLQSGMPAKVVGTSENKSVTLQYEGLTISGIIGFGKEDYGILEFINESDIVDFYRFNGKILAVPFQVNIDFLRKAAEAKIKGLVIPSIDNSAFIEFSGKEIGVALTGNEAIPYPVVITEGFGKFPMHPEIIALLKQSTGKHCFLQTFTQIRAGVTRPKIIITE